jgi:hypothetical protein
MPNEALVLYEIPYNGKIRKLPVTVLCTCRAGNH